MKEQLEAKILDDPSCRNNVVVQIYLNFWKAGDITLNEAILYALRELCRREKIYLDEIEKLSLRQPSVFYIENPKG